MDFVIFTRFRFLSRDFLNNFYNTDHSNKNRHSSCNQFFKVWYFRLNLFEGTKFPMHETCKPVVDITQRSVWHLDSAV